MPLKKPLVFTASLLTLLFFSNLFDFWDNLAPSLGFLSISKFSYPSRTSKKGQSPLEKQAEIIQKQVLDILKSFDEDIHTLIPPELKNISFVSDKDDLS